MKDELTMQVAFDLLHLEGDTSRSNIYITCPNCGMNGRKKKLNVNFEKNVFHCAKCDIGGGVFKFWALMRDLGDVSEKKSAADYYRFIGEDSDRHQIVNRVRPIISSESVEMASVKTRDNTYRALLSLLDLKDEHKKDLLRRGFTDEDISLSDYRSYPQANTKNICKRLLEKGCILKGVPGFYMENNGSWIMTEIGDGYLIPQKNFQGQIQGFQVRKSSGNIRYLSLSSNGKKEGTAGKSFLHYVKGSVKTYKLIITEGPLKGDLISKFTGYNVLALQGVNSTSAFPGALEELKEQGITEVLIAFDMDMYKNELVEKALIKLKTMISDAQLPYKILTWDESQKGLDDWLLAQEKK